jgi:hypothetical protein
MIINTDNSQVTFIKDRYGSLSLIAFQNSLQGFVDCFFDVFFKYSAISSESRASTVDTLTSIVGGFFPENSPQARLNFTAEVAGTTLPPKKQVVLAESGPLTIDYSSRNTYSVLSNMQLSTNGSICKTTTFLIITAGVADARPTSAPTYSFFAYLGIENNVVKESVRTGEHREDDLEARKETNSLVTTTTCSVPTNAYVEQIGISNRIERP